MKRSSMVTVVTGLLLLTAVSFPAASLADDLCVGSHPLCLSHDVYAGSAYPLRSGRPIVIDNLGAGRRIVECAEPKQCLERRHRCAPTVVAKHVLVEVNGQVRF